MILQLIAFFVIPLILSLGITPIVIRLAKRVGALDQPNERKVHTHPIPRFGGIAIYTSFFITFLISMLPFFSARPFSVMHPHTGIMLVISLTMVLLLGIWDDVQSVAPGKKFLGQFLAATIVYFAGFHISSITYPLNMDMLKLGWFDFPATILWIVGITNAFNLIDGLDGLASGVAIIVSLTISSISFLKGDMETALMALFLAGAVLGFLRYNFKNAKIFLGDSGSLFLGFSLAILSMQSSTKGSTAFSILIPLLTLGLPIMDTLLSMTRRFLKSVFPENQESMPFFNKIIKMFLPDRGHIHHQLIARGLSHRNVVLLLYAVSCIFSVGALAVTITNDLSATAIVLAIGVATFIGVRQLRYREMAVLRNGILLPLYELPLMNSTLFKGFVDLAFIVGAYLLASLLTFGQSANPQFNNEFFKGLTILCGIQLLIFPFGGLYRGTVRQLGVGDFVKYFKIITLSTVVSWIALALFAGPKHGVNFTTLILDYYLLLSFVLGSRISFHVLQYLSQRDEKNGKKKVLIYGASPRGALILQHLLNDESMSFDPIGFLDDDPEMEGKFFNGFPVFGGHWKLQRLLRKAKIHQIIISDDSMKPVVFNRLLDVSRTQGILLQHFDFRLDGIHTTYKDHEPIQEQFVFVNK
jgi:UDP-GlcNAc:undecaprenyl-phosphate GlcNAc-1-phosphate transferase